MERAERNKAIVRRFIDEMCNARKLSASTEIFGTNHVYHDPSIPEAGTGPEGIKQVVATYQTAFPDAHWGIEEMFTAENDVVVTRWNGRGTHKLELQGIPPTGKQVNVAGIYVQRIADDKIVETWTVLDTLGMLQQLGVVPQMSKTGKLQPERKN